MPPDPSTPADETLLQRFIQAYLLVSNNPELGPDPSVEELMDTEDRLSQVVEALEPMELREDQQELLRGARTTDLADLLCSTAAALRECPDVAAQLKTPPELLERIFRQDGGVSALIGTLRIFFNCVDTGMLLRAGDAERLLDEIDDQIKHATGPASPLSIADRLAVEGAFGGPMAQRQAALSRAAGRAASNQSAVAASHSALSDAEHREETAQLVHTLVERALKSAPLNKRGPQPRSMRRPELGRPLRFLTPPAPDPERSLSLDPAEMATKLRVIAVLAARFPTGALPSTKKMLLRKALLPEISSLLRNYADALALCPEITGDPEALLELACKLTRYGVLQGRGARWLNAAIDQRMALGALQTFILREITQVLVARLDVPGCTRAERERLETRFGKLLRHKEQLLADQQKQRELLAQRRQQLEAQAAEVERRTLITTVMTAVRQGQVVDQATLERAARYLHEQDLKDAQGAQAQPAKKPPR